jgi:uncharacterized protein YjbI with pentapeptide repeats
MNLKLQGLRPSFWVPIFGVLRVPGVLGVAAFVLAAACTSSPAAPSASVSSPTGIPESESVFATAEAQRKSFAGDCVIGPHAQCEGADFEGKDLAAEQLGNHLQKDGVDLTGANLRFSNMKGVNLYLADLTEADLTGADFTGANLNNVNFKNAVLSDAILTDANLSWANLRGTDMDGVHYCNTLMPDGGTRNDDC